MSSPDSKSSEAGSAVTLETITSAISAKVGQSLDSFSEQIARVLIANAKNQDEYHKLIQAQLAELKTLIESSASKAERKSGERKRAADAAPSASAAPVTPSVSAPAGAAAPTASAAPAAPAATAAPAAAAPKKLYANTMVYFKQKFKSDMKFRVTWCDLLSLKVDDSARGSEAASIVARSNDLWKSIPDDLKARLTAECAEANLAAAAAPQQLMLDSGAK